MNNETTFTLTTKLHKPSLKTNIGHICGYGSFRISQKTPYCEVTAKNKKKHDFKEQVTKSLKTHSWFLCFNYLEIIPEG